MFSAVGLFKFSMIFHVLNSSAQCDRPESWQLAFQDPASPILEGIINLHHDVMTILLFILGAVSIVMGAAIYFFNVKRYNPKVYYTGLTHHANEEFSWTLVPCLILLVIAVPSFALIYSLDDLINVKTPLVTDDILHAVIFVRNPALCFPKKSGGTY